MKKIKLYSITSIMIILLGGCATTGSSDKMDKTQIQTSSNEVIIPDCPNSPTCILTCPNGDNITVKVEKKGNDILIGEPDSYISVILNNRESFTEKDLQYVTKQLCVNKGGITIEKKGDKTNINTR